MPKKGVLIAFGELFLKSKGVREIFKKKLINNFFFYLKKEGIKFNVHFFHDRIFFETEETKKALKIAKNIFGITWFGESFYFPSLNKDNKNDKNFCLLESFIKENYPKWIKKDETFALRIRKNRGTIEKLAQNIKRKVDLSKPKRELFVEKRKNDWFLYFKKLKGMGGFPVGASGKVLVLISGGIDSPVAAFLANKRGAENVWLHFHSFPLVSNASIEKIKELTNIFLKYQPHLKVYFIPFKDAQMEIKTIAPSHYRVLLYRRLMLKIAQKIAKKEDCFALITGESLGQVSSQTLPNMRIIQEQVKIPVLRPLISFDKEEIVNLAKKIKTFSISIKPQEDCCTLFVLKHQTGFGNIKKIKELEKKLNINKIIKEIFKKIEVKIFKYPFLK